MTEGEQKESQDLIRRRNAKAGVVKRAYVLTAADENGENLVDSEIAQRYKVTTRMEEEGVAHPQGRNWPSESLLSG